MPIVIAKLALLVIAIYAFGIPVVIAGIAVVACASALLALRRA